MYVRNSAKNEKRARRDTHRTSCRHTETGARGGREGGVLVLYNADWW